MLVKILTINNTDIGILKNKTIKEALPINAPNTNFHNLAYLFKATETVINNKKS